MSEPDSAAGAVRNLESELFRLGPGDRRARRALEIGCGSGRLLIPMSWNFGEVHGVDVSHDRIRRALRNTRGVTNVFARPFTGHDLGDFPDQWFDFVYSHDVFRHIPSRDEVLRCFAESRRVLKTNGVLRCEMNGQSGAAPVDAETVADFAASHDMQLLAVEGWGAASMWITLRKRETGWFASLSRAAGGRMVAGRPVNVPTGAPAVPAEGPDAAFSLPVDNLPYDADLNSIGVLVDGVEAPATAVRQAAIEVLLPSGGRTGLLPVEVLWLGEPAGESGRWLRVIPPPPFPRTILPAES